LLEFTFGNYGNQPGLKTIKPIDNKKKALLPPGCAYHSAWISGAYFYVFGGQIKDETC
jgi:hypothetical protein